jgi:8-oxo-dGTP pyrophosphatase MutT (NUDIX family)
LDRNSVGPTDYTALSRERLAGYRPRRIHTDASMPAAVLLTLLHHSGADRVLLTVRSHTVEHHKGQISFPGGAVHDADDSLQTTALRETWEEVGIDPPDIEVIGQLDDIITVSNFVVTPFVGVLRRAPYDYVPSPLEVAEVIEPPIAHLLDPVNTVWDERQDRARVVRSPAFLYGGHRIWGATARMLYEFLCLLTSDVAGLEEARARPT